MLSQHQGPSKVWRCGSAGRARAGRVRVGAKALAGTFLPRRLAPGWGLERVRVAHQRHKTQAEGPNLQAHSQIPASATPASHVSRYGLRVFTPQSRGTPGSRRPVMRAQL